jgi:hypothetical protein
MGTTELLLTDTLLGSCYLVNSLQRVDEMPGDANDRQLVDYFCAETFDDVCC